MRAAEIEEDANRLTRAKKAGKAIQDEAANTLKRAEGLRAKS